MRRSETDEARPAATVSGFASATSFKQSATLFTYPKTGSEGKQNVKITLIRLTEVMARTALSRSGIYDLMAQKRFPNPVKIGGGRINAWPESEIDDWIAERISERVSWKSNSPVGEALL